jgi:hypothetical protein
MSAPSGNRSPAPSGNRSHAASDNRPPAKRSRKKGEAERIRRILGSAVLVALATPAAVAAVSCGSQKEATTSGTAGATTTTTAGGSGGSGGGTGTTTTDSSTSSGTGGETTDGGTGGDGSACDPINYEPDPPDNCGEYYRLPCGLPPNVVPSTNCYLKLNDCVPICGRLAFNCHAVGDSCVDGGIVNDSEGGVNFDCATCPGGVGRVPAGLRRPARGRARSALGDYFARAAHLEAASVFAFRRLRGELRAHGAPAALLRAAREAERDEVRHARQVGRLARRFGGSAPPASVEELPVRPLEEVAIENAVEGCVRETFGAAVASYQAAAAEDPEVARLMTGIARDETRHAALSWSIARWAARKLGPEARERMAARCRATIEDLRREASLPVPADLIASAGLPDAGQRRALLAALEQQLWRA